MAKSPRRKKPKKHKKRRYLLSAFVMLMVPLIFLTVFVILIGAGAFGPLPGTEELSYIQHHEASRVYSSDEKLLGTYYIQNRTGISMDEIPDDFLDALIAIEDIRYYQHNGIDTRAMLRVLVRTLIMGQNTGGGSTITQQLAKNLYPRDGSGHFNLAVSKIREMIIAQRLETIYTKEEILELYINTVSFGEETFGLEMAARRFFNVRPAGLELHQAAALAGMLRATTWYNPRRFPGRALQRRDIVLNQMERYGMISPAVAEKAIGTPLDLNYNRITQNEGPAPHFREHLRMKLRHILKTEPALDGNTYNLYTDGLRIETTLDSRVQDAAERAIAGHMTYLQRIVDRQLTANPVFRKNDPAIMRLWYESDHYQSLKASGFSEEEIEEVFQTPVPIHVFTWEGEQERTLSPHDSIAHYLSFLNAGFFAMEPDGGEVLAWAGSISHRHFQYDHVKARRQPGSAFKPVVYAAALQAGMQPCDYHRNQLSTYAAYEEWTPHNTQEEYGGYYSTQAALANSINTITVDMLMETGIAPVRQVAADLGISSAIPFEPSIALGTAEMSLMELTSAYAGFVNWGYMTSPYYLKAIYNRSGDLIYEFENPNASSGAEPVLSEQSAAAMVQMLEKAVDEGTGRSLRNRFDIHHALAGKTGTTQHFSDGWFIGMTPGMVFGTWTGGRNPRLRLQEPFGFASQTALPVAGYFLQHIANEPDLKQAEQFYGGQAQTHFNFDCEDWRDDRFRDRVREFFTGNSADEPRRVEEERERRSFRDRVRGLFGRD